MPMALVGPWSVCRICDGPLDRPYTATSGIAFPPAHRLHPYCDAPLHYDCLATWPDREEFSRAYFVGSLAGGWRGRGTVLHATASWFLSCGRPVGASPFFACVYLRDWPFRLYSQWANWSSFVEDDYRGDLDGDALDAATAVMEEVREVAPTLEALEALLLTSPAAPEKRRSYAEFGEFLATLWGEDAYKTDWKLLDAAERAYEHHLEEKERARVAAITQSNDRTRQLLRELETSGSLQCPHCHQRSDRIRFVARSAEEKSYFICRKCGGSFTGSEV